MKVKAINNIAILKYCTYFVYEMRVIGYCLRDNAVPPCSHFLLRTSMVDMIDVNEAKLGC